MICDCQLSHFNCEEKVRRFLGVYPESTGTDLVARDELIEKATPLVERTVNLVLQREPWRQRRGDAIQNTFVKLCNPQKLRTWLENPRRSWFCHWAYVVAFHCAKDETRQRAIDETGPLHPDSPKPGGGGEPPGPGPLEQAAKLRETINTTLLEFELEWRLVFYMRFSYLEPSISDIAHAAGISEEAVFYRLRKMKTCIAGRGAALLSPAVSKIVLVGIRHPAERFQRLENAERDQVNSKINELLGPCPLKEQFAFYMKYSPLAPDVESIADQVGEDRDTVCHWLEQIETQVQGLHDHG